MKLKFAKEPILPDGSYYHIRCKPGDIAPYVLLPGDPERVPKIAEIWETKRKVAQHREYMTYTGKYK
ncbi:MAG: uridine phosphorylase, partial [Thermoprotei archaeon]